MNKKILNINGIKVTLVDTDKFKSVCGALFFKTPIKEEMMVTRTLLRNILIHSCRKYPSNRELNINCLENYDTYYSSNFRRDGNYATNYFFFRTFDEKYTDKDNLKRVLDTFKEIIFNPNAKNNKFDDEEYNLAYQSLKSRIETRKERARAYASYKLCKQMGGDTPVSYTTSLKVLEKVTNESLYKEYLNMINNSEVSFVVAGKNVTKLDFNEFLNGVKTTSYNNDLYVNTNINDSINETIEEYSGLQSILSLGLKLKDLTTFERKYVMPVFNNILGGGTSSRMFNIIREENSLCYSCFSRYEKDDNLIEIYMGIENENYEKALSLTKEIVNNMKSITEDELKRAKIDITSVIKESLDNLNNYAIPEYFKDLYNDEEDSIRIDKINSVTLNDIKGVFKKVYLTDSFFLKGGKTNG